MRNCNTCERKSVGHVTLRPQGGGAWADGQTCRSRLYTEEEWRGLRRLAAWPQNMQRIRPFLALYKCRHEWIYIRK